MTLAHMRRHCAPTARKYNEVGYHISIDCEFLSLSLCIIDIQHHRKKSTSQLTLPAEINDRTDVEMALTIIVAREIIDFEKTFINFITHEKEKNKFK